MASRPVVMHFSLRELDNILSALVWYDRYGPATAKTPRKEMRVIVQRVRKRIRDHNERKKTTH